MHPKFSAQFVCPSPKLSNFWKKLSLDVRCPCTCPLNFRYCERYLCIYMAENWLEMVVKRPFLSVANFGLQLLCLLQVRRCTNNSVNIDNKMLAGLKRKKKYFRAMTNQIYILSKTNLIPVALFQQSNKKQSFLQFKAQVFATFSHLIQSIIITQWPLTNCYLAHFTAT